MYCNIKPMCVTAAQCLPRIHITTLEQSMPHLPSTADQYKMPHCHSQYYGKWQLWTNYEQFHGWVPLCLLAIRFLWQIWHWQTCDTSALLDVFGSLTHSDIFGCYIQSTTENWSREKIDLFRDLREPVCNCLYACDCMKMPQCVCMCMCI